MAGRLSPDGSKFALGTGYQLVVIDVKSGQLLSASEGLDKFGLIPASLPAGHFRPAGESSPTIFSPRWVDNESVVWSRRSSAMGVDTLLFRSKGESFETVDLGHPYLKPVCVNSDGTMVIPLKLSGRMAVMNEKERLGILEEASSGIKDFSFSAKAGLLLVAGDGKIRTWDVRSGLPGRTYEGIEGLVFKLDVSPGGTRLLAQSLKSIVVWDLKTGEVLSRYPLPVGTRYNSIEQVSFVDDTLYLLLEDERGLARLERGLIGAVFDFDTDGALITDVAQDGEKLTPVHIAEPR